MSLRTRLTLSSRWKKLAADVALQRGRMASMVVAIAAGMAAVAGISTAYGIIECEINASYLATRPPSALIEMDTLDAADLVGVRGQKGIAWAEASGTYWLRIEVAHDSWLPLLLFVVPDFNQQHISTVRLEAGRWPSTADAIVLERTAMPVANATLDESVTVLTSAGMRGTLSVVGVVYDPSLAPARQQQTVYGYVTPATLRSLGIVPDLRLLKLAVTQPDSPAAAEASIVGVAAWLSRAGHRLGEVRIPPRHHPHWGLMVSLVNLLLSFSVLAFLLSSVLTATLTASFLAPQVRQIGIMKALGARDRQVVALYAVMVAIVGCLAVGIGLPLGCIGGRALARIVGRNLNFDLRSLSISPWIYAAEALAGIAIPLLLSLGPIVRAARRPVRDALDSYGVANSLRSRSRLVLTVSLLAVAGALFITCLNLSAAWQRNAVDAMAERHFDLEMVFAQPQPSAAVIAVAAAVPHVTHVEEFSEDAAALARGDGLNLTHTAADGGHGSLRLDTVRPDSRFLARHLIEGEWLSPRDVEGRGTVLNRAALAFFPGLGLGAPIHVLVRGRVLNLKMVGVISEHLAPATLYVSSTPDAVGRTGGLRVSLEQGDDEFALQTAAALEHALDAAGFQVADSMSMAQVGKAYGGHLYIFIFTLGVMALQMAIVGVLGLASAIGTRVLERTREFAVMRAIGASRRAILSMVITEGVAIGALSVLCAAVLSVPLTLWVAQLAGLPAPGNWRNVVASAAAIPLWSALVVLSAAAVSAYPAGRAARLTVREALVYQ